MCHLCKLKYLIMIKSLLRIKNYSLLALLIILPGYSYSGAPPTLTCQPHSVAPTKGKLISPMQCLSSPGYYWELVKGQPTGNILTAQPGNFSPGGLDNINPPYGNQIRVSPCIKGTYSEAAAAASCTQCPTGLTTAGTGSTSSAACIRAKG